MLRYGENPHQRAALYRDPAAPPGLAGAEQLHGKEMSYNNYVDTDAALRAAHDLDRPCVAIIKHANPCGIAVGDPGADDRSPTRTRKAHACDPVSAFGGVIAVNRPVTVRDGRAGRRGLHRGGRRAGVRARRARGARRARRRSGCSSVPAATRREPSRPGRCRGGLLVQTADAVAEPGDSPDGWTLAAGDPADEATLADLAFAWRACRAVKSNAILLAAGGATVGVGMGQVNRVDSARLAVARAGDRARRVRWPRPTRSSRSPTGCRCWSTPGSAPSCSRAGRCATRRSSRPPRRPGVTLYLTGTRHFFH